MKGRGYSLLLPWIRRQLYVYRLQMSFLVQTLKHADGGRIQTMAVSVVVSISDALEGSRRSQQRL